MAAAIQAPSYQERLLGLGANGSGKSVLFRELLSHYPRWTVIDPKHDFEPIKLESQKYVIIENPNDRRWNEPRVLYRPLPEYTTGPWAGYFLRRLFYQARKDQHDPKKRRILYLDEGQFGARTGAGPWMSNIAIAGRALNLGFWVVSQRPAWIPSEIRTEAHRIYVFFLKRKADRAEVIDLADDQLDDDQLRGGTESYQFYELKRMPGGRVKVTHYPPIKVR